MAQYRLLADLWVPSALLPAGSVVSDAPGGQLPSGFVPNAYMAARGHDGV